MARKKIRKSLLARLELARFDLACACECDGRGCTICDAADTIQETIQRLDELKEVVAGVLS